MSQWITISGWDLLVHVFTWTQVDETPSVRPSLMCCAPWSGTRIKSHADVQRLIKEEKNVEAVVPVMSPGEAITGGNGEEELA